jgi:hypothetical protein
VLGRAGGDYVLPDPKAKMHKSLTAKWWAAEFVWKRHYDQARQKEGRRMNLFRRRTIPNASFIHESAYQRGDDYKNKLPPDGRPTT